HRHGGRSLPRWVVHLRGLTGERERRLPYRPVVDRVHRTGTGPRGHSTRSGVCLRTYRTAPDLAVRVRLQHAGDHRVPLLWVLRRGQAARLTPVGGAAPRRSSHGGAQGQTPHEVMRVVLGAWVL